MDSSFNVSGRDQSSWAGWCRVTSGCCVYGPLPLKISLYCFELNLTSSLSAAADGLSSTPTAQSPTPQHHISPTEGRALLTRDPLTAFSSQPAHTVQDVNSTAHASTLQPHSESLTTATAQPTTTGHPLTSGRGPAGPTHQEVPSELNVGDEGKVMSR